MSNKITVFAPASVANVGCGYDVLGFALEDIGDIVTLEKTTSPGLSIERIEGDDNIPNDPKKNVSTVAIASLLDKLGDKDSGFQIEIRKMVKPGSGLGSSASSSAAAVFGANELLGKPFSKTELIEFAGEGERAASGKKHFDNVAASILGGFTLIRGRDPLDVLALNYPEELYAVIAHPQVEVKTADARKILRSEISLSDAITQWANLSGFVVGLLTSDFELMGRSMQDVIAEPSRSILIPLYNQVKEAALDSGAIGCNIAGSGPSIFALCRGMENAKNIKSAISTVYSGSTLEVNYYISKVSPVGVRGVEGN